MGRGGGELNVPGRQKLGRYVETLSAGTAGKAAIFGLTTGLVKREPLIALSSHQGRGGNFCVRGTPELPPGGGGEGGGGGGGETSEFLLALL